MLSANGAASAGALRAELAAARSDFLAALAAMAPEARTQPRLVGEWGALELIAHLGYWVGHATEAIHATQLGRDADVGLSPDEIEERNQAVARVARASGLATVEAREAASFAALQERLEELDPALLSTRLADGETLEEAIRVDGADHYRQHTAGLLAASDGA